MTISREDFMGTLEKLKPILQKPNHPFYSYAQELKGVVDLCDSKPQVRNTIFGSDSAYFTTLNQQIHKLIISTLSILERQNSPEAQYIILSSFTMVMYLKGFLACSNEIEMSQMINQLDWNSPSN